VTAGLSLSEPRPRADRSQGFAGLTVMEVELCEPLPAVLPQDQGHRLWVLARLHTEPLGAFVLDLDSRELSPAQFGQALWCHLEDILAARFGAAGLPAPDQLTGAGLTVEPELWPFLRARSAALERAPAISVVVCTRNRPDRLKVCLQHLQRQQYPEFEVIVVDNGPENDAAGEVVAAVTDSRFRYVQEPRIGLSRARNTGISVASNDVVAFLDDDEEPDAFWLAALAVGFQRASDVGCVTGLILPARLDSEAQVLFEELGGHSKDRGFSAALFAADGAQSPLYPRPPFGAGGNMAFRREALTKIGGFDPALGAGTPARGAEDTLALTLVLLAGYKIAYEPAAFVRHHHYQDFTGLARQLQGYALGLTAFYTALVLRRPRVLIDLMRLLPSAIRYLRSSTLSKPATESEFLTGFTQGSRRAMLSGPPAYLRGTIRNMSAAAQQAWRTRK
jgi:O-antigen biosynthesis protein